MIKRTILAALMLLFAISANAQQSQWLWWGTNQTTSVPVSADNPLPVAATGGLTVMKTDGSNATAAALGNIVVDATGCNDVTKIVSGTGTCVSSAPPSGTAGGDLGGTYPNPTVTGGTHLTGSLASGLTIPSPTMSGTIAGAPTISGVWTSSGGIIISAVGLQLANSVQLQGKDTGGTAHGLLQVGGDNKSYFDNESGLVIRDNNGGTTVGSSDGAGKFTFNNNLTASGGVNKWTFTAPTTAATLTAGGDSQTYTMPNGTTTLVGTGTTQTLAAKTLDGTNIIQQAHEDSFTSNTSSGFTTITNLDQTFVAAGKYSCDGHMHFTTAPTTSNGVKLQLAGDGTVSITTLNFNAIGFNGAAFATSGTGTATALGSTAIAASQAFTDIILNAEIVINVGGVIHVQFNENATSGTIAGNARWNCLRAS